MTKPSASRCRARWVEDEYLVISGPESLHIQLEDGMGAFPNLRHPATESKEHGGVLATAPPYPQLPLGSLFGDRLGLRRFNHVVIKRRVVADAGPLGKADRPVRLHDQREIVARPPGTTR